MIILGIETSCDETSVAVLIKKKQRVQLLSNIISSSALIQSKFGGIFPEHAAREQLKYIIPVVDNALIKSNILPKDISAVAVTSGPGLIGSLLVGVETAKTLSLAWKKPLIGINHLLAHFYACWIDNNNPPTFPFLGLLVSGGHTDLIHFKSHTNYEHLGGTRDDAAGECFDKCARLLDLPYPGGPNLSKLAKTSLAATDSSFSLPKVMNNSSNYDLSFSGLKTYVSNLVIKLKQENKFKKTDKALLAKAIEATIVEVLVRKTLQAAKDKKLSTIVIAGGVAANSLLRDQIIEKAPLNYKLYTPPISLCTDNAATTAARAFYEKPLKDPLTLQANPNLSLFTN